MYINNNHFNWRKESLFYGTRDTKFSVVPKENLWAVRWPDGVISADVYNKDRAKENAFRMARAYYETKQVPEPV